MSRIKKVFNRLLVKRKSVKERKKSESEKANIARKLRDEEFEKKIRDELSQEEILKEAYISEIGEYPTNPDGSETEDFVFWKKAVDERKSIEPATLRDIIDNHISQALMAKDQKSRQLRIRQMRLDKIAREIAATFPYEKIIAADMTKGGNEVHGWLQINFDDYEDLLEEYVLDRAAYYGRMDYAPTPITIVESAKLGKYVRTGVQFLKPVVLDHHPEQPFNKAIFYAKENLEKAVNWTDGVPWLVENFPTSVNLGKANLALVDWALWNVPVFLVTHAPGKDYGVFNLTVNQKEKDQEMDEIRKQIIHDLRKVKEPLMEKIDEKERGETQWREAYTNLKNKAEVERGYNLKKNLRQMDEEYGDEYSGSGRKNIWNYLIIVVMVVLFILVFVWMANMNPGLSGIPTNSTGT
ncbi:MAG: hypothetical protein GY853_15830 [PVC group bacterium]|nr:hypothetical protein [PVC group bacterium]